MSTAKRFFGITGLVLVVLLLLAAAMIIFRVTYALQAFSFNSSSNEPTIPQGKVVFTSNLKEPARFDFIAFQNKTEPGSSIWMFRICGIEGDSVEIRRGDLYVNGTPADAPLTLSHSYIVKAKDTVHLNLNRENDRLTIAGDTILVVASDSDIKTTGIPNERYILPQEVTDARIEKIFGQPWNIDNFGPVAVPKGSYFLLGDSRTNSLDSRYLGFINKKDYRGTLLRK